MPFRNSVVGGITLVRAAIRSPNYIAGVSGWSIDRDGSAEFNDITIRGGTIVGGDALYYNGTPTLGNLLIAISAAGGTDSFGNTYSQGFTSFGSDPNDFVRITDDNIIVQDSSGAKITLTGGTALSAIIRFDVPNPGSSTWFNGYMFATSFGSGNDSYGSFAIRPPNVVDSNNPKIDLRSGSVNGRASEVIVESDEVAVYGEITTYNLSGWHTYTPVLTGFGTATFTTRTGYWQRIGSMIFFQARVVVNAAGSGAGLLTITAPTSISRGAVQTVLAQLSNVTAGLEGTGALLALTSGSGAVWDLIRGRENTSLTGADLLAGCTLTIEGWYREL